jgi:hypothetical protein
MNSAATIGATDPARASARALQIRQTITVALLFAGYAGYYFCRSDLSVAMPLLVDELHAHGMASNDAVIRMGQLASFGVLAYAVGKLTLTGLGDVWGGKRSFTIGLGGAIAFTLLFASGGFLPLFTIAWIVRNRDRHSESKFPGWRRGRPSIHGHAHPSGIRLEALVLLCRHRGRSHPACESLLAARVASETGILGAGSESAESVCRGNFET